MLAYKLFSFRKDGSIGPLFINRRQRIPLNKWMKAEEHPTKGFAFRPGWHCTTEPVAPHLSEKNRVWALVEIKNYTKLPTNKHQGNLWFIAKQMRVLEILNV